MFIQAFLGILFLSMSLFASSAEGDFLMFTDPEAGCEVVYSKEEVLGMPDTFERMRIAARSGDVELFEKIVSSSTPKERARLLHEVSLPKQEMVAAVFGQGVFLEDKKLLNRSQIISILGRNLNAYPYLYARDGLRPVLVSIIIDAFKETDRLINQARGIREGLIVGFSPVDGEKICIEGKAEGFDEKSACLVFPASQAHLKLGSWGSVVAQSRGWKDVLSIVQMPRR